MMCTLLAPNTNIQGHIGLGTDVLYILKVEQVLTSAFIIVVSYSI